jgi:23S rRNA-/tRNA-specific pseudouridylate synthase
MVATGQATAGDNVAAQSLLQGIVHRLDKDTSGVVVVAKHLEASSSLSHLFKTRKVQKRYLAGIEQSMKHTLVTPACSKHTLVYVSARMLLTTPFRNQ